MPDHQHRRPALTAVVVVIPAHNEAERIGACVASVGRAITRLLAGHPEVVVRVTVAADRCTDATVARAGAAWPVGLAALEVVAVEAGSVGAARAAGVAQAVAALGPHDPAEVLVVNTDADCVVPPGWLVDHLALAADHDVVLGEIEPDPGEMGPAAHALWWARHPVGRGSLHGANLAVRLDAYLRAGGFPAMSDQEDLHLVRALRAQHADVVGGTRVMTSARRLSRVPEGFAGYLRRLDADLDAGLDAGLASTGGGS